MITLSLKATFFITILSRIIILDIIILPWPILTFFPNSINSQSTQPPLTQFVLNVFTPRALSAIVSRIGKFNCRASHIGHFLTTPLILQ